MKGYVVMSKGFEYNDEINYQTDGGFPQKIYFNIEDAKKEVQRLNLEKLKIENISDYAYDLGDILNVELQEFEKFLEKVNENHGGKETPKYLWQDNTYAIHSKATEDELEAFCKMISLVFYEYVEVEVDTESFRDNQTNQVLG